MTSKQGNDSYSVTMFERMKRFAIQTVLKKSYSNVYNKRPPLLVKLSKRDMLLLPPPPLAYQSSWDDMTFLDFFNANCGEWI